MNSADVMRKAFSFFSYSGWLWMWKVSDEATTVCVTISFPSLCSGSAAHSRTVYLMYNHECQTRPVRGATSPDLRAAACVFCDPSEHRTVWNGQCWGVWCLLNCCVRQIYWVFSVKTMASVSLVGLLECNVFVAPSTFYCFVFFFFDIILTTLTPFKMGSCFCQNETFVWI